MFNEADDTDETIEFIVLLNSVPIHFHKSKNIKTPLRKYFTIAFNKKTLDDSDEALLDKKVRNLISKGKTKIKKFIFLKLHNINLDKLAKKE